MEEVGGKKALRSGPAAPGHGRFAIVPVDVLVACGADSIGIAALCCYLITASSRVEKECTEDDKTSQSEDGRERLKYGLVQHHRGSTLAPKAVIHRNGKGA